MLQTAIHICDTFIANHRDRLLAVDYELIDHLRSHMNNFMQPHVITTYLPDGRTKHSGHRSNAGLLPITKDANTGEVYLMAVESYTKHTKNPEYFMRDGQDWKVRLVYSNCHGFAEPGHTIQQTAIKETLEETRGCFGWFDGGKLIKADPCRLLSALSYSDFHRVVPPGDYNNQWLSIINMGPTTEMERNELRNAFYDAECIDLSQTETRGISFIHMQSLVEGLKNVHNFREQRLAVRDCQVNPTPLCMHTIIEQPSYLLRDVFQSRLQPHTEFIQSVICDCSEGRLRPFSETHMPSPATISFLNSFLTDDNLVLETHPPPQSPSKPRVYYKEWLTKCSTCNHPCGRWPDELEQIYSEYKKTHKSINKTELHNLLYPRIFECSGCKNVRQKRNRHKSTK